MWEQHLLDLIRDTDAPSERARLTVMFEMAKAVRASTVASETLTSQFLNHRTEFQAHVLEEQVMFAQGKGMIKMLSWAVPIFGLVSGSLVGLAIWVVNGQMATIAHQGAVDVDHERRLILLESRNPIIDEMRARIDIMERKSR